MTNFLCTMSSSQPVTSPASAKPLIQALKQVILAPVTTLPLPHHAYNTTEKCWQQQAPRPAPILTVGIELDRAAYGELQLYLPKLVK